MKIEKDLLLKTLRNVLFAVLYIFGVSQIMVNGEKWFGKAENNFTPFVILLLFSLSAAIVGGLIFGQSLCLFLNDRKKESITAAFYSIAWLGIITTAGLLLLLVLK